MDENRIKAHLAEYAAQYPAIISVEQAAEITNVSRKTICHWSSLKRFDPFKSQCGRLV